jgi:hypothetical protein
MSTAVTGARCPRAPWTILPPRPAKLGVLPAVRTKTAVRVSCTVLNMSMYGYNRHCGTRGAYLAVQRRTHSRKSRKISSCMAPRRRSPASAGQSRERFSRVPADSQRPTTPRAGLLRWPDAAVRHLLLGHSSEGAYQATRERGRERGGIRERKKEMLLLKAPGAGLCEVPEGHRSLPPRAGLPLRVGGLAVEELEWGLPEMCDLSLDWDPLLGAQGLSDRVSDRALSEQVSDGCQISRMPRGQRPRHR